MAEYKIAIIGPEKVVSGFRALDVKPFFVETGSDALEILKTIKKDLATNKEEGEQFAVVLIIERILQEIDPDELAKVSSGALPAVVALPGIEGSSGAGVAKLKALAERAIGSDILG